MKFVMVFSQESNFAPRDNIMKKFLRLRPLAGPAELLRTEIVEDKMIVLTELFRSGDSFGYLNYFLYLWYEEFFDKIFGELNF